MCLDDSKAGQRFLQGVSVKHTGIALKIVTGDCIHSGTL